LPLVLPREILTFDLRSGARTSNAFYTVLRRFTEECDGLLVDHFRDLITQAQGRRTLDLVRRGEALADLLTLAVLFRLVDERAPRKPPHTLAIFAEAAALPEVKRSDTFQAALKRWEKRLKRTGAKACGIVRELRAVGEVFEQQSERVLGRFTPNVEPYRAAYAGETNRDDAALLATPRLLYHLQMVTAQLLNDAYRAEFLRCPEKIVLLPVCMRAHDGDGLCKAAKTPFGLACAACTEECRVRLLMRALARHGVRTFVEDELVTIKKAEEARGRRLGVVGVGCVLMLAPSGREAHALGLPCQGVFLDYCGCKHHWDREGFVTDFNLRRLEEILGLDVPVA